ncbi:WD repeat, SAM and U-box domain-containing protein 1 isoform X2 [Oopsacas minuta]|uniref:WD repeat, SAM and U-box domain-containing protein 1 isoform X2 n=1 Tax=Oopsacas minuta TaxID=111878 RepID=A0AAV7JB02_9METZ|nr:WD repeat, SAM and U-box domain-containing protein 1 isoform X2 [Oopsacas minuta]
MASVHNCLSLSNVLDHSNVKLSREFKGHGSDINCVQFHPIHSFLFSCSGDKTCRVWNVPDELQSLDEESATSNSSILTGHTKYINSCVISAHYNTLFTASTDGTIRVWDLMKMECTGVIKGHKGVVQCLALSPDEGRLVSGSGDSTIRVWDPVKRTCLRTLSEHDYTVVYCSFSHDGIAFVSASSDGKIIAWDKSLTYPIANESAHPEVGTNICVFSPIVYPNSYLVATAGNDNLFKLWSLIYKGAKAKFNHIWTVDAHGSSVYALAFSPDGSILVSGGGDASVMFWRVSTKEQLLTLNAHEKYVTTVAFSRDSRYLATGAYDGVVKLWKLAFNIPEFVLDKTESLKLYPDVPNDFICPISLQIMTDPVIIADGSTYDRSSILLWLATSRRGPVSPLTNLDLPHTNLKPNCELREEIEQFLKNPDGYSSVKTK